MRVVVIGAGMAGCAAARRLTDLGHEVVVVEANGCIGGRTRTVREDDFALEAGGDTLLSSYQRTRALADQLGVSDTLVRFEHTAGLHDGERLWSLRAGSPLSYALSSILTLRDKVRLGSGYLRTMLGPRLDIYDDLDAARIDDGESMATWVRRHFGETTLSYVIRPNIETRWYFSCDEVPAAIMVRFVREALLVRLMCVTGGMSTLLAHMLTGVDVHTSTKVDRIEIMPGGARIVVGDSSLDAEGAIVATTAPEAAELLPGLIKCDGALREVTYSESVRVLIGYAVNAWTDQRPASVNPILRAECPIATVSLVSRKSRGLVPQGREVVAVHFTGAASRTLEDTEAVAAAHQAVKQFLPPTDQVPSFVRIARWRRALPIPRAEQLAKLRVARRSMPSRIRLAGDYFALATIESAVRSGWRAAEELHVSLQ